MTNTPFQIDTRKLVLMLLPSALRKPTLYHIAYRLIEPITTIYRSWYQRRLNNMFYARYDSGFGNIERMLNIYYYGSYDVKRTSNGIFLQNTSAATFQYDKVYVTTSIDDDSAFVGDSYVEAPIAQELFDVYVPNVLYTTSKSEIEKMVSNYVLPGIGFKVISYE